MRVTLTPHPTTPGPEIEITVEVERAGDDLMLSYSVSGRVSALLVQPPANPARTDDLWKHTCFEAFIGGSETPGYVELNLAPSQQWAAYAFDDTRLGMRQAVVAGPDIVSFEQTDRSLDIYVRVGAVNPRDIGKGQPWRLGLSAVIEETGGRISYWALAHPSDKPDFHHPDSFVLELP